MKHKIWIAIVQCIAIAISIETAFHIYADTKGSGCSLVPISVLLITNLALLTFMVILLRTCNTQWSNFWQWTGWGMTLLLLILVLFPSLPKYPFSQYAGIELVIYPDPSIDPMDPPHNEHHKKGVFPVHGERLKNAVIEITKERTGENNEDFHVFTRPYYFWRAALAEGFHIDPVSFPEFNKIGSDREHWKFVSSTIPSILGERVAKGIAKFVIPIAVVQLIYFLLIYWQKIKKP